MEKPPYEGKKRVGYSEWEWGVQYYKRLHKGKLIETPAKTEAKETQTLHFEVYDFDYAMVRMEDFVDIPAVFWELSQEELEKRLGLRGAEET
jgi:hypothetical protein